MMLRKTLLSLFALIFFVAAFGQGQLSGTVTDDKGLPVRFANVSVVKTTKDALPVVATLTDSLGRFSLVTPATGTYLLRLTAIGFAALQTDSFAITSTGFLKDFGTLLLTTESKKLENINITALRPTIVQLADRMVVSVEGTAMAAGNNAFTVLAKAPGVFVDQEGGIQLNGKGGVTVMIDGRPTYLSARDLRNLLETMSADNIKSIEIITAPSSRYDAEGASGIINIVLKKNTIQGINGSVNASYNYNFKQHGFAGGTNINLKLGKWNAFGFLDFSSRAGGREATFTRVFFTPVKNTYFNQVATGNFRNVGPPSVRLGADYDISSKHSIGGMVYFVTSTSTSDFLTDTYIANTPGKPYQYIDADNFNTNTFKNLTTNLHYTAKLDTLGSTLSADADYARITNKGKADFFNSFTDLSTGNEFLDNLYTTTPNAYSVRSGKVDWIKHLSKTKRLEAGLKTSRVESDNDFRFYFNNAGLVIDPQRTNHFFYEENIYAAYVNYSAPLSKKLSMQAGLRAEQTESVGTSFTTGQVTPRNYLGLFPSLFLQHKISENYGINYNISRRLQRPNYGSLNPFRSYRDPYTWTVGNPYLRPSYAHILNITQTFRKQYVLQLYYQYTKDVMIELPILDVANAITVYTEGNVDDGVSAGATAVVPVKLRKFWDVRNTLQLTYNRFTTVSTNGSLENKQLSYTIQSIHTLLLPKDYRFEATILFRGPNALGLYRQAPVNWVDLAVKKSFAAKKLDISLTISDIFKGYRYQWTTNINGNINDFDQYFRFRAIGLSLRYNFSKGQKTNTKQRSGPEELNRT